MYVQLLCNKEDLLLRKRKCDVINKTKIGFGELLYDSPLKGGL